MTWIKIDDEILDHPKIADAGALGWALHIAGLIYCGRNLTDGRMPRVKVRGMLDFTGLYVDTGNDAGNPWYGPRGIAGSVGNPDPDRIAEHLITVGLWEAREDDRSALWIHDYLDYNPSREQVLAERNAKREAGKRGGQASAQARAKAVAQPLAQAVARAERQPASQAEPKQKATPVPGPVPVNDSSLRSESQPTAPNVEIIERNGAAPFVAAYVDACVGWGSKADSNMKGRVGKVVNRLLADGRTHDAILYAVSELARTNKPPDDMAYMARDYELTRAGTPMGRVLPSVIRENPIDADIRVQKEILRNGVR